MSKAKNVKRVAAVACTDLLGLTASGFRRLAEAMDDAYQAQRLDWEVSFLAPILLPPKARPVGPRTSQKREGHPKSEAHLLGSPATIDDLREACKARAKHRQATFDKLWRRILVACGLRPNYVYPTASRLSRIGPSTVLSAVRY
jgi:hypothetical protein